MPGARRARKRPTAPEIKKLIRGDGISMPQNAPQCPILKKSSVASSQNLPFFPIAAESSQLERRIASQNVSLCLTAADVGFGQNLRCARREGFLPAIARRVRHRCERRSEKTKPKAEGEKRCKRWGGDEVCCGWHERRRMDSFDSAR